MADERDDYELTEAQAAKLAGRSDRTIRRWVTKGDLVKKRNKISRSELEAVIEKDRGDPYARITIALDTMTEHVQTLTELSIKERETSHRIMLEANQLIAAQAKMLAKAREKEMSAQLAIYEEFGKFLLQEREQQEIVRAGERRAENLKKAWEGLEKMLPHVVSKIGADSKTVKALESFSLDELKQFRMLMAAQGSKTSGLVELLDGVIQLKVAREEVVSEQSAEAKSDIP